jgi:hypothetical protein
MIQMKQMLLLFLFSGLLQSQTKIQICQNADKPICTIYDVAENYHAVNVQFTIKHYQFPFVKLPEYLSNERRKGQLITDYKHAENRDLTSSETMQYDASGKIVSYKYSPCMACSTLGNELQFVYNLDDSLKIIYNHQNYTWYSLKYISDNLVKITQYDNKDNILRWLQIIDPPVEKEMVMTSGCNK